MREQQWWAVVKLLGSIPGHTDTISEIGYLLLQSRDMAE